MLFRFCLFDAEQLVSLLDSAQLCTPSYLAHDLPSDSLVAVSHLARGVLELQMCGITLALLFDVG